MQTVPTTICIEDDSNGNTLEFSTVDGTYTFTDCDAFTLSGTGKVKVKGCTVSLQDVQIDRRVLATVNLCGARATASAQTFAPPQFETIIDRNTADDECGCGKKQ